MTDVENVQNTKTERWACIKENVFYAIKKLVSLILIGLLFVAVFAVMTVYMIYDTCAYKAMTYDVSTKNDMTVIQVHKTNHTNETMKFYVVDGTVCRQAPSFGVEYEAYKQDGKTYNYKSFIRLLKEKGYEEGEPLSWKRVQEGWQEVKKEWQETDFQELFREMGFVTDKIGGKNEWNMSKR